MPDEIHRIVDANEIQMDSNAYPSSHVFINEMKCIKAVNALNAQHTRWFNGQGKPPFRMQSSILVWRDRSGIG